MLPFNQIVQAYVSLLDFNFRKLLPWSIYAITGHPILLAELRLVLVVPDNVTKFTAAMSKLTLE